MNSFLGDAAQIKKPQELGTLPVQVGSYSAAWLSVVANCRDQGRAKKRHVWDVGVAEPGERNSAPNL